MATTAGLWMVGVALNGSPHWQAREPGGPARLALADANAFPPASFEAKWAPTAEALSNQARLGAQSADRPVAEAAPVAPTPRIAAHPAVKVKHELAQVPTPTRRPVKVARLAPVAPAAPISVEPPKPDWLAKLTPSAGFLPPPKAKAAHAAPVPLPRGRPAIAVVARAPVATPDAEAPAPHVAVIPPPSAPAVEKRVAPREAHIKGPALPGPDSRTALYDISGHTVYMPDGTRLEAHSGLGSKLDDPRYIRVRMRGPTPPNVYDLTLRAQLFHGVRAIRLNPVYGSKMFGRDGMLAHTYMLGPSGQSNGCVSFKNYHRFLQAFLDGRVDRMVVVRDLAEAPQSLGRLANLQPAHHDRSERYAANIASPATW
ncbi:MAG TPA: tlde1 domain-containing protein [Pseudolabrys sp.]|nr:tlde1 domain-containing protein [Pseudolabrys sp.]